MSYICARVLQPEFVPSEQDYMFIRKPVPQIIGAMHPKNCECVCCVPKKNDILVNRFQTFSRVRQYWIVNSLSRIIDKRLEFIKKHHQNFFTTEDEEYDENVTYHSVKQRHVNDDDNLKRIDRERDVGDRSNKLFLHDSITGSPRHLKKLAHNTLAVVSEYGKPTCVAIYSFYLPF
jgi:hypothetical protein